MAAAHQYIDQLHMLNHITQHNFLLVDALPLSAVAGPIAQNRLILRAISGCVEKQANATAVP